MSTYPAIGKALDWVSTGSSYEEEMHGLIWSRVRLLFAIGVAASLILFLIDNIAVPYRAFVSPIESWRTELWLVHSHHLRRRAPRRAVRKSQQLAGSLSLAMWVTSVQHPAAHHGSLSLLEPGREPHLAISLLLFTYAAFIPVPHLAGLAGRESRPSSVPRGLRS